MGIRMRPLNDRELGEGLKPAFRCQSNQNAVHQLRDDQSVDAQFHFDKVFDESAETIDVYNNIGKDMVKGVMKGINGTIFACEYHTLLILLICTN